MPQASLDRSAKDPPAARLIDWYDRHARVLPWRSPPGETADPYRVWLSEAMLQQTTVAVVQPYFHRFLARWPTVRALAAAPLDDVLAAWAGLGYYARARNLHACARRIVAEHDGLFPSDEKALRELPGIGAYTAAAIGAIAFGRPAVVVDGNVLRVIARLFAVTDPLPGAKPRLTALAGTISPARRPGDYAQALMDLGATICTPRRPACAICPWQEDCAARKLGIAEDLPAKTAKAARPVRRGIVFWTRRSDGAALLRRRPDSGLLGGMMEIPSTPWRAEPWQLEEALSYAPVEGSWTALPGMVGHGFTHFALELAILAGRGEGSSAGGALWCPIEALAGQALPSVMRKVVKHALAAET